MSFAKTTLLVSTALFALASQASAATAPATAAADVQSTDQSSPDDVIVTAQKREQTLIDVPQSISVVTGDQLERLHATNFQDYLKMVPGLQLSQATPGEGRLTIRGLNTGGVASTVAVYEDETPFGSSSGLANGAILAGDFDTFDVARIEVLRGPQGTLYGASSLGGVLKFVTNAPDTSKVIVRGRAGVETVKGGEASYYGSAVVNIPLNDDLAFRASGTYRNEGGFIDSIGTGGSRVHDNINGARVYGGRASLLYKPFTGLSVQLSALIQNIDTEAPSTVESDPNTLETRYGRPTQSIFVMPFKNINYRIYNGLVNYDFGFATLTSSTSYSTQLKKQRTDQTFQLSGLIAGIFGSPNELYLAQHTNVKKFTQELRLASSSSPLLDWVVGGYYTHEEGLIQQEYVPVVPGTLTRITALGNLAYVTLDSRYEEIAGFANATVHLGEMFDIDLGGRYSHNNQRATQDTSGPLAGGVTHLTQTSSDNVFTYSVAPKIKFGTNASIYGRVAKGFRPGGPNALSPGAPANVLTYQPDSVVSYEVGVKAQTEDRKFSIDVSAFHIDWSNIQLIAAIGSYNVNANGRRAASDGVEFTATARPIRGLDLSINGALTNARLLDDSTAAPGASNLVGGLAGDKLPFSPRYSVSVNGDYRWSVGGETFAYIGASLRSLSKQNGGYNGAYRLANGRQRVIPSYEVVDLRAGLELGKYALEAYVKNLGNSDGKQSTGGTANYPAGSLDTGIVRPRTIGVSVTAGF